jgi:hypothetical protein
VRTALAALAAALLLPLPSAAPGGAARAAEPARAALQQVRIHLVLSRRPIGTLEERDRIRELQEGLLALLDARGAGRLARDAWPDGACVIWLEGADARAVWALVEGPVRAFGPRPGSFATISTGAGEERVPLDEGATPAATPPR